MAEDFFTNARKGVRRAAQSNNESLLHEYHQLIDMGLQCLAAALQQSKKFSPRVEAIIRLQYGAMLCEETENITEAEVALQGAIKLCEKVGLSKASGRWWWRARLTSWQHRIVDLKLFIQFLCMKALFQRNSRATFIALDGHIADCVTYVLPPWQ